MQNYILRYDLHAYFLVRTSNSPRSLFTKRREFVNNNTVQRHWLFIYTKLNDVAAAATTVSAAGGTICDT